MLCYATYLGYWDVLNFGASNIYALNYISFQVAPKASLVAMQLWSPFKLILVNIFPHLYFPLTSKPEISNLFPSELLWRPLGVGET